MTVITMRRLYSHHVDLAGRFSAAMQHDIVSPNGHLNRVTERGPSWPGRIENESVIEYPMAMRTVLLRCLVVLVALTFVGGATVNARTHPMSSGTECLSSHDTADAGASINKSSRHHNAHVCPCCCLGCASFANRAPA